MKFVCIKYQFNLDDLNTMYFNSVEEQSNYFDSLKVVEFDITHLPYNDAINFSTSLIVKQPLIDNTSINYGYIELEDKTRKYYFLKMYVSNSTIVNVDCSLDVVQTYYFRYRDFLNNGLIKRGFVNKYRYDRNNKIGFNNDTRLLISETLDSDFNKINYPSLNPKITYASNKIQSFFDDVDYFIYMYVNYRSYNRSFYNGTQYEDVSDTGFDETNFNIGTIDNKSRSFNNDYMCFILPVFKDGETQLRFKMGNSEIYSYCNAWAFINQFRRDNNNMSFVYKIVASKRFPFGNWQNVAITYDSSLKTYTINVMNNTPEPLQQFKYNSIVYDVTYVNYSQFYLENKVFLVFTTKGGARYSCFFGNFHDREYLNYDEYLIDFSYFKSKISNTSTSLFSEPKLYHEKYRSFSIGFCPDGRFDLNYLLYGSPDNLSLYYFDSVSVENNKYYIRIGFDNDEQFKDGFLEASNSLYDLNSGDLEINDNSFSMVNDQYNEYLANNKNLWYIQGMSSFSNILSGGIIGGASGGPVGAVVGAGTGIIGSTSNFIKTGLELDNRKNAPKNMKMSSGNINFLFNADLFKFTCLYYQAPEIILQKTLDYLNAYAYTLNIYDFVKNYDNVRSKFNYIECKFEYINLPISNEEKELFKNRFERGIRFHTIDSDFSTTQDNPDILIKENNDEE